MSKTGRCHIQKTNRTLMVCTQVQQDECDERRDEGRVKSLVYVSTTHEPHLPCRPLHHSTVIQLDHPHHSSPWTFAAKCQWSPDYFPLD